MKLNPFDRLAKAVAVIPLAVALCLPATVIAGAFTVTPVRIYMSPRDRAIAVTVTNDGDAEVVLQADLHTWNQKPDGTDELVLTDELILSPPILKLAPKARQVVRLARLVPPDLSRQMTYRFILREIPEVNRSSATVQIPIALALSMPVFITPPGAKREVSCNLAGVEGKSIGFQCKNSGSAYAQIREIEIARGEQRVARFEGGAYILPGASKTIAVGAESAYLPGAARAVVTFDDNKTQEFAITLQ